MKKNILIASLLVALLAGCVTGEKAREVEIGMSRQQVEQTMGRPDGSKQVGNFVLYRYTNRLIHGWSWDRADYSFIFKDNKLVEYGPGEVREKNVGGIHTLFIHNL